jgi:hypothetical protein
MLRRIQTKDSGLASNEIVDELSCFIDWTTRTSTAIIIHLMKMYIMCSATRSHRQNSPKLDTKL